MDPIADMLSTIKNSYAAGKKKVVLTYSRPKLLLGQILAREGFLAKVEEKEDEKGKKEIVLSLSYRGKNPALSGSERLSRPGRRLYARKDDLGKISRRLGTVIISTPMGLLTAKEALEKNQGGELICRVW
ncbi:30S ribosomal protein S8 [Candidatus Shapirobacteria bacterium]|nr:30S ribosomal protein S8 [Candidatus Shapirobacteria bacterium]